MLGDPEPGRDPAAVTHCQRTWRLPGSGPRQQISQRLTAIEIKAGEVIHPAVEFLVCDRRPGLPVPATEVHFGQRRIDVPRKAPASEPTTHVRRTPQGRRHDAAGQAMPPRMKPDAMRQPLGLARVHREIREAPKAAPLGTDRRRVSPDRAGLHQSDAVKASRTAISVSCSVAPRPSPV